MSAILITSLRQDAVKSQRTKSIMNSRVRRRRFTTNPLLLSLAWNADGFSVSPNGHFSRKRVHCHERVDGEDNNAATMSTALCVIPPDEAWDTIQRARHMARDRTYHKWPPAVRLFHPFCPRAELSDKALDIARIVEEYDIEPFQISLDTWTIVPHMEAIEADWEAMKQLPTREEVSDKKQVQTEADLLIAKEERIGRQRLLRREKRSGQTRQQVGQSAEATAQDEDNEEKKPRQQSPRELLEKQKRQYEEFNGPCVLCLEPNEESRERLIRLRELLRSELFEAYDKFSPSSSVSTTSTLPRAVLEAQETSFRPLVPIGNFPTVTSAVEKARKLKGLWDPLLFNVTDFHLISYENEESMSENQLDEYSDNAEYNLKMTSWRHADVEEETLTAKGQFGCDALVMLMGEEVDTDEEGSKDMVDLIMSHGSPGGACDLMDEGAQSYEKVPLSAEDKDDDDVEGLELWLDGDDEWDEGTVIVIGRTHFFTGEMRTYNGMPASSAMDAKDRVLGKGVHSSARRKGSAHRAFNVWKDGEFGYRESDFVL